MSILASEPGTEPVRMGCSSTAFAVGVGYVSSYILVFTIKNSKFYSKENKAKGEVTKFLGLALKWDVERRMGQHLLLPNRELDKNKQTLILMNARYSPLSLSIGKHMC